MKKLILFVALLAINSAYAADIRLNISSAAKNNPYFLCIYDEGCIRISASNETFPLAKINMGNIKNFGIANPTKNQIYMQPSDRSCQFQVESNQKVTISGNLVMQNSVPHINNLRCQVS